MYQEKIEIEVQSDGLVNSAPGSITLGPNAEEDFYVTVKGEERMSVSSRNLVVKATVTEMMGLPPPNIAEAESKLIISIMQFSGLQLDAVESLLTLETKVDYNVVFKVYNQGNGMDKFRLAVAENSHDILEDAGFTISLPMVNVEIQSMVAPMTVRVIMRTPTGYEDWPINSEGQHEMTFELDFIATSDFSCKNEGNCLTETVTTTITVFAEASESEKLLQMEETLHSRIIGQDEAVVAVSRAIRRRLSGANTSKVRMLCSRSAIFTKITRRSLAIAMAIFWKFSACASARELKVILLSLLTPSTRSATVLPN